MGEESINLQVLHWPTTQGKVPQGDDDSWGRLLRTRVSRIFLLRVTGENGRCENSS